MLSSRLARSFLPATAVLEMTYACTHRCLFCSCPWDAPDGEFKRLPEMGEDEWCALITRLCDMGVVSFAVTGGEPLLKKGLANIIEHAAASTSHYIETRDGELQAWDAPPKLYLLSNGSGMTGEILNLCKKHDINLSMSLPGLTTFAEHTGGHDPQHVLRWFRRAKDMGVRTTVGITVTQRNIHELYETMAQALIAGADTVLLNRFLPGGRGLEHVEELALTRDQIPLMLDTAEEVLRTANRLGSVGTELPKCLVNESKYEKLKVGTRCSAALDFFVVGPSGYVRVCHHSTHRLNHVSEIEKLKDHEYWRRFALKRYLPKACAPCEHAGTCDAGCREAAHIVTGQVDGLDPLLPPDPGTGRRAADAAR